MVTKHTQLIDENSIVGKSMDTPVPTSTSTSQYVATKVFFCFKCIYRALFFVPLYYGRRNEVIYDEENMVVALVLAHGTKSYEFLSQACQNSRCFVSFDISDRLFAKSTSLIVKILIYLSHQTGLFNWRDQTIHDWIMWESSLEIERIPLLFTLAEVSFKIIVIFYGFILFYSFRPEFVGIMMDLYFSICSWCLLFGRRFLFRRAPKWQYFLFDQCYSAIFFAFLYFYIFPFFISPRWLTAIYHSLFFVAGGPFIVIMFVIYQGMVSPKDYDLKPGMYFLSSLAIIFHSIAFRLHIGEPFVLPLFCGLIRHSFIIPQPDTGLSEVLSFVSRISSTYVWELCYGGIVFIGLFCSGYLGLQMDQQVTRILQYKVFYCDIAQEIFMFVAFIFFAEWATMFYANCIIITAVGFKMAVLVRASLKIVNEIEDTPVFLMVDSADSALFKRSVQKLGRYSLASRQGCKIVPLDGNVLEIESSLLSGIIQRDVMVYAIPEDDSSVPVSKEAPKKTLPRSSQLLPSYIRRKKRK